MKSNLMLLTSFVFIQITSRADALMNGCTFDEGPVINGQATWQITSADNSGKLRSVIWLKSAEGVSVSNAGPVNSNAVIQPSEPLGFTFAPNVNQEQAADVCFQKNLELPTLEEFEALRNCFAAPLNPIPNLLTPLAPQELALLQSTFPTFNTQIGYWSATDATGKSLVDAGENPAAYVFGYGGDYEVQVTIGEVGRKNDVRCVSH